MTPKQKLNNIYAILCEYCRRSNGSGGAYTTEDGFLYNAYELKISLDKDLELRDMAIKSLKYIFDLTPSDDFDDIDVKLQVHYKKLKVLEIIKDKNVDVGAIKVCVNSLAYNDYKELTETKLVEREKLTRDEFGLLKEVLL